MRHCPEIFTHSRGATLIQWLAFIDLGPGQPRLAWELGFRHWFPNSRGLSRGLPGAWAWAWPDESTKVRKYESTKTKVLNREQANTHVRKYESTKVRKYERRAGGKYESTKVRKYESTNGLWGIYECRNI